MTEPAFPWLDIYAAERLFMKPRAFRDLCKRIEADNPGVRIRRKPGKNWILTREDWNTLLELLPCPSNYSDAAACGGSAAQSEASLYTKAQKLINGPRPKKSASNVRQKSSVVPFTAPPRPQVSARQS